MEATQENPITKIADFEKELQQLDPGLAIMPNPNRGPNDQNKYGISNVKLNGSDVCPVPSEFIKEFPDPSYFYTFPNDMSGRYKSKTEVIDIVKSVLKNLGNQEYSDAFYGRGEFENEEEKPELATEPLTDEQKKQIEN